MVRSFNFACFVIIWSPHFQNDKLTRYAMRSVSIARGSQLLPPAFASIFDDLASSSLDIFFDPSQGLMNLPGFKSGMFTM